MFNLFLGKYEYTNYLLVENVFLKVLIVLSSYREIMKMTSMSATIADLECRNGELESIIGPFREQLMQYESERLELIEKKTTTEKELRVLELNQAKVLGHQNHRQKIRHVVHLTEQITELKTVS